MLGIEHYPGVRKFLENPAYTEFWSLQAVDKWLAAQPLTVPTMLEVGQWDQEDSYGAPAVYRALEPKDMSNDMLSRCVIGPWRHSGANHYGYDLGALTFTGDTALEWRAQLCEAVLRSLSEGRCRIRTRRRCSPMRRASTSGRTHRAGRWARRRLSIWPRTARRLSSARQAAGHDEYVSDPAKPVPFIPRPIDMSDPNAVEAMAGSRPALRFGPARRRWSGRARRSTRPVHIMGAPEVDLFAATTGTDSDWVVKLIDVYPNDMPEAAGAGREAVDGGLRAAGRHRDLSRPLSRRASRQPRAAQGRARSSIIAGRCPTSNHVFLPGHRIMVQVQSSLFPLYDRNPQTFVPNIFFAKPEIIEGGQRIYHGGRRRARCCCRSSPEVSGGRHTFAEYRLE